jgi:hypothetical protein
MILQLAKKGKSKRKETENKNKILLYVLKDKKL